MQQLAKKLLGKLHSTVEAGLQTLLDGGSNQATQQQPQQQAYAPPVILSGPPLQQPACPQASPPPPPPHNIPCRCRHVRELPALASAAGGDGGGGRGGFAHPGTLMGPREVALLQARARGAAPAPPPFQEAVQSLAADTPLQYSPHALVDVLVEWYDGPKLGHDELVEQDGKMVYMQTLMWLVSGDERYASNAAAILLAWATTNKTFHGRNAPLEAGWALASMARSAELLKHTWPGWPSAGVEGPLLAWVNALLLPALNSEALTRLPLANWQTTVAEAKGALALLTGDAQLWADALDLWVLVASAYLRPCGECGETSRDLFHTQFGLGGLIQLAEMAWQQGTDLYSHDGGRLCTAMEFHACIILGGCPPECGYPLKGVGFLPTGWEVGFNHYHGRMGWPMPQTEALLAKNRPEKYVFHWGLGSLTHANTASVLQPQQQQQQQQQQGWEPQVTL